MMTQGVMTQAVNLFGNASGSVTLKGKQSNSSFDLMIDSTMKSGTHLDSNSENTDVKKVSNQNTGNGKKEKSDAVEGNTKQADAQTSDLSKSENARAVTQADNQTRRAEDTKETEDATFGDNEETIVDEATLEKIAGLLQEVQKTVMELLNLTSEELDKLLSEQGLVLADLFQPENMQQLVLADSRATDILAVLTDENLSDTMKQLLQSVEDLMASADLGMSPDQIKSILDRAKLLQESNQVTNQEGNAKEQVNTKLEPIMEAAVNVSNTKVEENINSTEDKENKSVQVEVIKVTDAEASSSGKQADLSKNENQELKAADQFEVFLNNLSNASTSNQVKFDGNLVQVTEIREIANQIIERIRVTIRPEQSSMELQLNPENLGKVNLSVQSKNGIMTAQFVVQNEISKEAIESQLQTLKDTLNQQGIKVEAIEVTVTTYFSQQNSKEGTDGQAETKQGHSSNKISLEDAISMTEETEETISRDITGIRGNQIDYTA
jgi:flagellar hook-length control protein FliK